MNNQTVNDYFKHHWAKLIVFVLFTAVVSFFAPLKSFQLKWLIDSKSKQEALGYMGLVFLITFTSWFFERLSRRSFTKLACGAVEQVRGQVMERVLRRPVSQYQREGDAAYLSLLTTDPRYTSPYKFYQFWLNVSDEDAKRYIKIFTALSKEEIDALTAEHEAAPHLRVLQKCLAKEVTIMVHSEEDYNAAVDASNILFGNATSDALKKLDEDTLLAVFEGVPQFEISRDALAAGVKAVDLFVDNAAVFASKGEMRKLVQGGGVSLNKEKLAAFDQVITTADLLDEKYLLVQRGKKNYYLIIAK